MRLLIIRGDLQSHSGYSAAARDYCGLLGSFFDRQVGVDIHYSPDRPYEKFAHPVIHELEAQRLAAAAEYCLVLSFTTPDCYSRYPGAVNVGLTFWETDRLPLHGAEQSPWVPAANAMDEIWAPSSHTKDVFAASGVTAPIRVMPWPIRLPAPALDRLPDGEIYNLDRHAWCLPALVGLARFREPRFRWSRWLMKQGGRRSAARVLNTLRTSVDNIPRPREQAFLSVAQDVPRKGLLLLLAEWMEFKRRMPDSPWVLILKSTPIDPQTPRFDFVSHFWDHVLALKHQLRVPESGVYLWTGDLGGSDYDRLLVNTFGQIAPSLGEGFCGPAALALALGKPLVAPCHTSFADYLARDYPYRFATRPVNVSFVRDPLRVYDPASQWHIAEPGAIADALGRLVADPPECRAEICWRAAARCRSWCGIERVSGLLAEAVRQLLARPVRTAA